MSALSDLLSGSPAGVAAGDALAAALRAMPPETVLVGLDLEACAGPQGGDARDADKARIVQIALTEVSLLPLPGQVDATGAAHAEAGGEDIPTDLERAVPLACGLYVREDATLVDPLCEVDAASSAVHGVTREAIEAAQAPRVDDLLDLLDATLRPPGRPVLLVGYNAHAYDAVLLAAELRRVAGRLRRAAPDRTALADDLAAHVLEARWLDPGAVRRRAEGMDLTGSVRRYLGCALPSAHNARYDIAGTLACIGGVLVAGHAGDLAAAAELSAPPPGAYDRAGKLTCDEGVDPATASATQVRYAFGKHKGTTLAQEPSYARWMLTSDFPEETKARIRALLATLPADAGAKARYVRR